MVSPAFLKKELPHPVRKDKNSPLWLTDWLMVPKGLLLWSFPL